MEKPEPQPFDHYGFIYELPTPRRVRVALLYQVLIGALPVVSVLLIYAGMQQLRASRQIGMHWSFLDPAYFEIFAPAILILISAITFLGVRRDIALLRDGATAEGVVTHQKLVAAGVRGNRRVNRVRYRFNDSSGQMFQNTGQDNTGKLLVDMTVPVFYDPKNPDRNVAISSACCELRFD
jgi:hypothetical protein